MRQEETGDDSDRRGHHARDQRFGEDQPKHLPARRAERAQQGELARPLRDEDAEGVDDDVRADKERDQREHQQDRSQDAEERVDARHLLADDGGLGRRLRVARQARRYPVAQLRFGDAGRGAGCDLVELALQPKLLLDDVEPEERHGGAGQAVGGPVAGDAGDDEVMFGATVDDVLNVLTDGEEVRRGRGGVDDDVVAVRRRRTGTDAVGR